MEIWFLPESWSRGQLAYSLLSWPCQLDYCLAHLFWFLHFSPVRRNHCFCYPVPFWVNCFGKQLMVQVDDSNPEVRVGLVSLAFNALQDSQTTLASYREVIQLVLWRFATNCCQVTRLCSQTGTLVCVAVCDWAKQGAASSDDHFGSEKVISWPSVSKRWPLLET